MIKKKQDELKEWLKKSNISIASFSERVFYHLHDSDNEEELKKFKEKFKKDINRNKNIELINNYLEILYQQPEFLKLGHIKTTFLYKNKFNDKVNQRLKILYKEVDKFVSQANDIINENEVEYYDDIVLDTLYENTKKSNYIFQEIVCLVQSQFYSGAYGRWRSLHELLVVSLFIKKHGKECAISYIKSISAQQKHVFDLYIKNQEKLPESERFTVDEQELIKETFDNKEDDKNSYTWSSTCIKQHSFANIEKDVNLEHLRTFYKKASMLLHGNIDLEPESIGLTISHPVITFYDMIHIFILKQIEILEDKKSISNKAQPLIELKKSRDNIQNLVNDLIEEYKIHLNCKG